MNLTDIIALAKQGYKPSDIKELVALETESSSAGQIEKEGDKVGKEPEQEPDKKTEPEVNYKDLYEKQVKEIEQIREELKIAQSANVNTNIANETEKNVDELLADAFREYM